MSTACNSDSPLDIVYLFRHSKADDREIQYSLRSVAENLPFIRKVWIFGDRPTFLVNDRNIIEHVPHAYVAPVCGFSIPVRNDFVLLFLASLIPGLAFDFARFSDDYIILQSLTRERLCTVRALEDLNATKVRGRGQWKEMLWRTYDILKQFGYPGINFETHLPQPLTRQLVFEVFVAFREFISEDRYSGMQGGTTIHNYALFHHNTPFVWLSEEKSKTGFYGACPSKKNIADQCNDKLFLSFDDDGFGPPMLEYLQERFPDRCKYERSP